MARSVERVAIVGLGLIGSSIARAIKDRLPGVMVTGHDASADVCDHARTLGLCDHIADTADAAVAGADLVILAVPVGRMADAAAAIAPGLKAEAIISDVGSSKTSVAEALAKVLPDHAVIPAHPVAGTENSGPAAGFASLFDGRWCIVTPGADAPADAVAALTTFWEALGARVDVMDAAHHDLVLAVTSHLPHLIAYTIVGTASELEEVTESEVIKYSAGGFRDFTRIAASDPVMWRDVFLANKDAVLATLQRFNEDLTVLQQAIRRGDGAKLEEWFTRTRAIRRSIIEQGQDDAAPDFGRRH
ncbi:prephenate/arogenate dehydrogenase family protein [Sphingopyxis sp. OPL5]|uniref:prephenate/arogenate dehydrogenase family protein n=1 Tax=Sphingopyxis sp. OPL5 TaxID=2486273 RepID=UPI00164D1AFF|nr:prephenate/arogenate dehydrogenase family protein [Sphingopyxis sp. OPL5]QNO29390.1 prephenate/arogenate dehydrogenase family protein [Sphingopyxis sp. OPL5]